MTESSKAVIKADTDKYISTKAIEVLKAYQQAEAQISDLKKQVDAVKKSLYTNMSANGVKSFETDDFKFTMVPPSDTTVINADKMKDEGVYEYYKDKPSHKDGYVKYTAKKKKVETKK